MADYTMAQIRAMQEDAARRVREMNRRSKSTLEHNAQNNEHNEKNHKSVINHEMTADEHRNPINQANHNIVKSVANSHKNPLSFLKSINLKQLISGGDQSLLLLIILILMSDEKSDDYLIYALIYIML